MANKKLTSLTAIASLAATDIFYVVDDPGGTPLERKCTFTVLAALLETTLSLTNFTTGTLPVARGGTGATSFTSGRVPYYDGSTLADSPIRISSGNVGIGAAPSESLRIEDSSSTIRVKRSGVSTNGFTFQVDGSNDAYLYNGDGRDLYFGTNNTMRVAVRRDTGNVGIGTASQPGGGGTPVLTLAQTSGDPTSLPSNCAGLTAKDSAGTCELYAWDEAGNVTVISPHSSLEEAEAAGIKIEPLDLQPAVQHSHNIYTGVHTWRYTGPSGATQIAQQQRDPQQDWMANQERQAAETLLRQAEWDQRRDHFLAEVAQWKKTPLLQRGPRPVFQPDRPMRTRPVDYERKPQPRWR